MAFYDFRCDKCDEVFEVAMSIKDYDGQGQCPTCKNISTERIWSSAVYFVGASVESPEYNPGLGQIVKNSKHRKEICKEKGLIEVGNEKPETIRKHLDKAREEKLKKSWDEV